MRKILFVSIFFLFLSILPLVAQQTLSLQDFLELTAAGDPRFPVYLTEAAQLQWGEVLGLPAEDWNLAVSSELTLNFPEPEYDNISGGVALSRLFRDTGTAVSGSWQTSPLQSTLSLQVSQELARGAFGRAQNYRRQGSRLNTELARFQLTEAYEDYLAAAAAIWFDWQLAYADLQNARLAYEESQRLLSNVRQRAASSIASESDVDRSLLQFYNREEALISTRADYREKSLRIHQYTGIPEETDIRPDENFSFPESWWKELPESPGELGNRSRSGEILQLLVSTAETEYLIQQDDLLPSVQFYLQYDFSGQDYDFQDSATALTLGIAAELDWPNGRSRAESENLQLEHLKQQQSAEAKLTGYWWDLRKLRDQILLMEQLIESAEKRESAAERVYNARNADYRQGRASLSELINDQNTLQSTRHTLISRRISLNALRLEWFRLTDQLVTNLPE